MNILNRKIILSTTLQVQRQDISYFLNGQPNEVKQDSNIYKINLETFCNEQPKMKDKFFFLKKWNKSKNNTSEKY